MYKHLILLIGGILALTLLIWGTKFVVDFNQNAQERDDQPSQYGH